MKNFQAVSLIGLVGLLFIFSSCHRHKKLSNPKIVNQDNVFAKIDIGKILPHYSEGAKITITPERITGDDHYFIINIDNPVSSRIKTKFIQVSHHPIICEDHPYSFPVIGYLEIWDSELENSKILQLEEKSDGSTQKKHSINIPLKNMDGNKFGYIFVVSPQGTPHQSHKKGGTANFHVMAHRVGDPRLIGGGG